jgi:hypothetical protein
VGLVAVEVVIMGVETTVVVVAMIMHGKPNLNPLYRSKRELPGLSLLPRELR